MRGVIFCMEFSLWQPKRQEPKLRLNAPNARAETTTASRIRRTILIELKLRNIVNSVRNIPFIKKQNNCI